MSSSPFTVDMDTVGRHVPTTPRFINEISGKESSEQFPPNGLNAQKAQSMYVIVHSGPATSSAEELRDEMQNKGLSTLLLCLQALKDLDEIQLDSVNDLYMIVDISLFDLLFKGRHLHPDVDEFMDELEKKEKCVNLLNRMGKGDNRFMKLFHHLPDNCAKIVREITVKTDKVKDAKDHFSTSVDSGIADLSLSEGPKRNSAGDGPKLNSAGEDADSENKLTDSHGLEQRVMSDPTRAGPGGDKGEVKDTVSKEVASLLSSTPGGTTSSQGSDELSREEIREDETEESEDSDDEAPPTVHVHPVQIGYKQTMEVNWTDGQMVNASQQGFNNTMEVNIVPPASRPKVIVVITTNPNDEKFERMLMKEITDETERINVRFETLDASNLKVWSGSVVIEIEVKPGVTIDKAYIQKLMKIIFSGKVGKVIPEGTKLGVDIEAKMVVPFDQLGKYVHLNSESPHENCVSKDKYEEKVKEVCQLQRRLVQDILKNPKQDQVLQNALKNFISSVLTEFAFAMTTETPALPVTGSKKQELPEEEDEEKKSSLLYNIEEQDDAIRKLELQLKVQNLTLTQVNQIVAEIESLKRLKRSCRRHLDLMKETDETQDTLHSMREERDQLVDSMQLTPRVREHEFVRHGPFILGEIAPKKDSPRGKGRLLRDETIKLLPAELLKSVYGPSGWQPNFSVKREGPLVTIEWTEAVKGMQPRGEQIFQTQVGEITKEYKTASSGSSGMEMERSVLIFHSDADRNFADELREYLEMKQGHGCSLMACEPGESDFEYVFNIVGKSKVIIIIVSENVVKDRLSQTLMNVICAKRDTFSMIIHIIPVILDDTPVPLGFRGLKNIKIKGGKDLWQKKLTDLLESAAHLKDGKKSSREKIEQTLPQLLANVYGGKPGGIPSFTVEQKGAEFKIRWNEEEKPQRKLFTIVSQKEEETGMMKTGGQEPKDADSARKLTRETPKVKETDVDDADSLATKLAKEEAKSTMTKTEVDKLYDIAKKLVALPDEMPKPLGPIRTVRIEGLTKDITQDTLEIYFENRRRSQGGEITNVKVDERKGVTLIEFADAEVAERVVAKNHVVSGVKLTVQLDYPGQRESDKKTLVVSNYQPVSAETVQLHFENKQRSGGGENEMKEEKGKIYLMFQSEEVAERVLKKCPHKVADKTLTVSRFGEDTEDAGEDEKPRTTIKVSGFEEGCTDDSIYLYFENKRKSGGGDIVGDIRRHAKEDIIYIEFEEEQVARRVVERPHTLNGRRLEVELVEPQVMYRNKALISGVPELESSETLLHYLEGRTHIDVRKIFFVEEPGEVLVSFGNESEDDDAAAVGRELASIGDKIQKSDLEERLVSKLRDGATAEQYEAFRSAVYDSLGRESSWHTIAAVLFTTKNVLSRLGASMAAPVKQLAMKFIQDECADFIVQQGGWESVVDEDSDFDID